MAEPVNQNTAATDGKSFPETGKKLPDAPNGGGTAGYVLVPRQATKAMLDAAYAAHDAYDAADTGGWGGLGSAYAAMIAAAPAFAAARPSGGWRTDFQAAEAHKGDILAGAYSSQGAWRQAVVGYAAQIFWDWPFGETPTHWRSLPDPPSALAGEARSAETEGLGPKDDHAADLSATPMSPQPPSSTEGEEMREAIARLIEPTAFPLVEKGAVDARGWATPLVTSARLTADRIIAGPLSSLRSELKAVREERDEAQKQCADILARYRKVLHVTGPAIIAQKDAAEAEASHLRERVEKLEEELRGWKSVAVLAAIPLEAMRMAGSYRALAPSTQTCVDEAVVTIRMAVAGHGLPPEGDVDAGLAPARAALSSSQTETRDV